MQEQAEHLGFVGLGNMGQPIAERLVRAMPGELEMRVYDTRPERLAPLVVLGAQRASGLAEVARPGGIVCTMVGTEQELLQITLGEGGLLRQLGSGGIHLSLYTVSLEVSTRLARLYQRQGSTYLVATVLGRPDAAHNGTLSLLVAGSPAAKQRVWPLLSCIGAQVEDLGTQVEAATITKLACNFLIASAIEAMGEAAALVESYGLPRARFLQMLVESPLFRGAVYEGYGAMIGTQDFSASHFPVAYGLKDVELARRAAARQGMTLPIAEVAFAHLQAAQAAGRGAEDWSVFSAFTQAGEEER